MARLHTAGLAATLVSLTSALNAYNADPSSVSVSGISAGGFMSVQLGVAYSSVFQTGFGVFAGGPFDCARDQPSTDCMLDEYPYIEIPTAHMEDWSGNQIDDVSNLQNRMIFMEVGSADTVVGVNPMDALSTQLSNFVNGDNVLYTILDGQEHTFPTDFNGAGDNLCDEALSPFISNCAYDGAGAVLQHMYGNLNPRNTGTLTGSIVSFAQTGNYGSPGMDTTGYLFVPRACQSGSTVCKVHVALHGCGQSYDLIGDEFINYTGYNKWADTNNIIIVYPQAVVDDTYHETWDTGDINNQNACFDWVGWYGDNADQHGGVQMAAIVAMVEQITSGFQ